MGSHTHLANSENLQQRIASICPSPEISGQDLDQAVARCYSYQHYQKRQVQRLGVCETFIILDSQGIDHDDSPHMNLCVASYLKSFRPVIQFVLRDFKQSLADGLPVPKDSLATVHHLSPRTTKYRHWRKLSFLEKLDLCVDHLTSREWAYYDQRTDPKEFMKYTPFDHSIHIINHPGEGLNPQIRSCDQNDEKPVVADGDQQSDESSSLGHTSKMIQGLSEGQQEIFLRVSKISNPLRSLGISLDNATAKCYTKNQEISSHFETSGACEIYATLWKYNFDPTTHDHMKVCLASTSKATRTKVIKYLNGLSKYIRRVPSRRRSLYQNWSSASLRSQVSRCQEHMTYYLKN
ncbi:MAG: hypothetical protein OXC40_04030 [Proteobacteria bacterium]|nr:hypothetical protein [Pseudomonadota bacterium]